MANDNKTVQEQVAELREIIKEQSTQIAALEAAKAKPAAEKEEGPKVPTETFKVAGKTYRFRVAKFIDENRARVLAKDALEQPATLERLVLLESGVIELVK